MYETRFLPTLHSAVVKLPNLHVHWHSHVQSVPLTAEMLSIANMHLSTYDRYYSHIVLMQVVDRNPPLSP